MAGPATIASVRLYGREIGQLVSLGGDRTLFSYADDAPEPGNGPMLSLSHVSQAGSLIRDHRPTQTRLAPFFSNLLPEGPLRILDIGGGAGETAKKLLALGHSVEIVVPSAFLAAR